MKNNPIGIFDSGVGGLSITRSIRQLLPNEDIIYIADTHHAPYGNQSAEFLIRRSTEIVDYFIQQNVKLIVVACNTATVNAIEALRAQYTIPIVGVEPGIKPAVALSEKGRIGVLATAQTLKGEAFTALLSRFSDHAHIETQACSGLVELIESKPLEGVEINTLLNQFVAPMLEHEIDTFVMGCTHYAFLNNALRHIVGEQAHIIHTHDAVANETQRKLAENNLLSTRIEKGSNLFLSR